MHACTPDTSCVHVRDIMHAYNARHSCTRDTAACMHTRRSMNAYEAPHAGISGAALRARESQHSCIYSRYIMRACEAQLACIAGAACMHVMHSIPTYQAQHACT